MKQIILLSMLVAVSGAAHAELIVAKGAKATLQVEYVYSTTGSYSSPSKDQTRDWKVQRTVNLTAQMVADAPQPVGVMSQGGAAQSPMMADMQKIAAKCGNDQNCLMNEMNTVASAMQQSASQYQLWRSVSQSGTYSIDELHHHQVFEMTCNKTDKLCRREETRKGSGPVPAPAGGQSTAGASMLEVNSAKKELVVSLPVPLAPLNYTQTVVTTVPGEKGGVTQTVAKPWMLRASKPMTVTIPTDLKSVSGTQSFKLDGTYDEGGTVTVKWRFSAP